MSGVSTAPWEDYLQGRFPAYLLPASHCEGVSEEAAQRFLDALTGKPHLLRLLKAAASVAAQLDALTTFVRRDLPDLLSRMPARSEQVERRWHGGFQGRLLIPATNACRLQGDPLTFVTRNRFRSYDLPENVFLRATVVRLAALLHELVRERVAGTGGWGASVSDLAHELDQALARTALRNVHTAPADAYGFRAARDARHPAYAAACAWHTRLGELDQDDASINLRLLTEGALAPVSPDTRFELAVLFKLVEAMEEVLVPLGWCLRRTAIVRDRQDVACFERPGLPTIHVGYNRAILPKGARDQGAKHYLASHGVMRPDITVWTGCKETAFRAVVFEVKHSEDASYVSTGWSETMLYRWEYAAHLPGWPKAVLVTSHKVPGLPTRQHDVVASGWDAWVPVEVVTGVVDSVVGAGAKHT